MFETHSCSLPPFIVTTSASFCVGVFVCFCFLDKCFSSKMFDVEMRNEKLTFKKYF